MAETDPPGGGNGVTADDLQAAAARLRPTPAPQEASRGGVAIASDPLLAAMASAIDRMGPIPGREEASDISDSEWDDPAPRAAAPAPSRIPSAAPQSADRAIPEAPAPVPRGPAPTAPEADIAGVLQQRLAARRAAIIGEDSDAPEREAHDAVDISFQVKDALSENEPALAPPAPSRLPPVPPRDDLAPPVPPRDDVAAPPVPPRAPSTPPPVPPRDDVGPPVPPRDAPVPPPIPPRDAAPAPNLPLLTAEQSRTYAAQVERQTAALTRVNAFLGTPEGANADRTTSAMVLDTVTKRGAIMNLPSSLASLEARGLPPDQQRAEVDKLLAGADDYDRKAGRLEARVERIAAGRDPGPDLPNATRPEYETFAGHSDRLRDVLQRADRAMDPKAPLQPDAAVKAQAMETLTANSYMAAVPVQLEHIDNQGLAPAARDTQVSKVLASLPDVEKRVDAMHAQLDRFSGENPGSKKPDLPGLTAGQQAEFSDRSARMRGMLNHLDRMMDPKAPRQPDAAMKTQTLELLNANAYMLNVPSELKKVEGQNLDPAAKQAAIDKVMAPLEVVDKRMDASAKGINDFYVGKDRPPAQLTGVTAEQNKEYALRSRRMDAMLEGLDRMNDPKLPVQPGKAMQKETLELLRANAYLKELPKDLQRLDAAKIDPAAKAAQVEKLMAPMADIDQRMGQMDRRMIGQAAEIDAGQKRGRFDRLLDRVKEYGSRAAEAIGSIPDRIRNQFSTNQNVAAQPPPQIPAPPPANHITVKMGPDESHQIDKGVGTQTSGAFERIEHRDGKAMIHYRAGMHEQVLSFDEKSAPGKAIAAAVEHFNPGDKMELKLSHGNDGHEVAELANKTSGANLRVHDTGQVERNTPQVAVGKDLGRV